ncbi:hypothetical protein G4B88_006499 [Cannabis sativa]|uniref:Uncharacterized protein n=1 Tax=Cannabis sativa TaxID=3483 RepID=A0A7J6H4E5_CANSA|nr:hypothetical protein G4B88_006499 [Cannabis sativa]
MKGRGDDEREDCEAELRRAMQSLTSWVFSSIAIALLGSQDLLASVVEQGSSSPSSDDSAMEDGNNTSLSGCKACGREEVEKGCNGEGRIQGGIATFPGFGWWPIKAYRPCPGFVESGGRYKRTGQSLDEVAFGRSQRD